MLYRELVPGGEKVSALGFGCMRLPVDDGGKIDRPTARTMLDTALEGGVDYLDTAWPYHGGESEPFLGEYLAQRGGRAELKLATKMPCWLVREPADFDRFFDQQLERLGSDYIDYYLLHALDGKRWKKILELGAVDWMRRLKAEGRIRHIGFSFHDDYPAFEEILSGFDWEFCQIQYNYMDIEFQAGRRGLRAAAERGVGVAVMEPLLGGRLVDPPARVAALMAAIDPEASAAELALRWVWDHPEAGVVLSGMSTFAQVRDNLIAAERSLPRQFSAPEQALFDEIRSAYRELTLVPCTACGYCVPCPHGVDIPRNFKIFNAGFMYGTLEPSIREYGFLRGGEADAGAAACIQCGECEPKCPQGIPIPALMPEVDAVLDRRIEYRETFYHGKRG